MQQRSSSSDHIMPKQPTKTQSSFMTLPPEIRPVVYEAYFDIPNHTQCHYWDGTHFHYPGCDLLFQLDFTSVRILPSLFYVNKDIQRERAPVFWTMFGKFWALNPVDAYSQVYCRLVHTEAEIRSLSANLLKYAPAVAAELSITYQVCRKALGVNSKWDRVRKKEARRLLQVIHHNKLLDLKEPIRLPHQLGGKWSSHGFNQTPLNRGITLDLDYSFIMISGPLAKLDWAAPDIHKREGRWRGIWSKLVGINVGR